MSSPDAQGRAGEPATPAIHPGHRVIAMFPFCEEREKLALLVPKIRPGLVDKWMPVDDGSTDDGAALLRQHGIEPLTQPTRRGIGAAIKAVVRHARANGYDILVVMAGNNKDDPGEIPRLLEPILEHGVDYVQGSRFLEGGSSPHLPLFRRIAIQMLSLIFRMYSGRRCTDLTNGFRAYRLALFDDPRIDIEQEWLDDYEYEYYVHWKAYTLGYRVAEVPVTKTYPGVKGVEYSKIKPITGWWRMLRPFILLALGIKK
jgi:dolichol-phosphate mannosyltransferase